MECEEKLEENIGVKPDEDERNCEEKVCGEEKLEQMETEEKKEESGGESKTEEKKSVNEEKPIEEKDEIDHEKQQDVSGLALDEALLAELEAVCHI
jgi:hypothetical protein